MSVLKNTGKKPENNDEINFSNVKDFSLNTLSVNPTKWSNTLKQFVDKLPTNCLSVFDHFVRLALKWLKRAHSQFSFKRNIHSYENLQSTASASSQQLD